MGDAEDGCLNMVRRVDCCSENLAFWAPAVKSSWRAQACLLLHSRARPLSALKLSNLIAIQSIRFCSRPAAVDVATQPLQPSRTPRPCRDVAVLTSVAGVA